MSRMLTTALVALCASLAVADMIPVNIGLVTHFIGNGTNKGATTGAGPNALLNGPNGCAVGSNGYMYFADSLNSVIRRVRPGSSDTEVWLGALKDARDRPATGTAARLNTPWSIKIMPDDINAYITDFASHKIYSVTLSSAVMANWAGTGLPGNSDGSGIRAQFNGPVDLAIQVATLNLFICEALGNRIRKATPAAVVSMWVGSSSSQSGLLNGNGLGARFNSPYGIAMLQTTSDMFVSDTNNFLIRLVSINGDTTTFVGNGTIGHDDGFGTAATFGAPYQMVLDNNNKYMFIADRGMNIVRRLDITNKYVVTVIGDLSAHWSSAVASNEAQVASPSGACLNRNTNVLYITGDHSVSFVHKSKTMTASLTKKRTKSLDLPTLAPGQTWAPTPVPPPRSTFSDNISGASARSMAFVVVVAAAALLLAA
jgi:hypothetical protein